MRRTIFSIPLFLLLFGVIGCAMLQETPPVEIPASRLTCADHPEMVDGDLSTIGTFAPQGFIKKEFTAYGVAPVRQYQRRVEGSLRTETLIKLDAPTYIRYIEVYPASPITNFAVDTTREEKSRRWGKSFTTVEDKRAKDLTGTLPVRVRIEREVLYMQMKANAVEDRDRVAVGDEEGEMRIPLKGAQIREVKFYGR